VIEGWPVLTIGTTDQCRSFHPYGYAIVSGGKDSDFAFIYESIRMHRPQFHPKVLIADNAAAIHNGFITCKFLYKIRYVVVLC